MKRMLQEEDVNVDFLDPQIEGTIQTGSVHVAIFSPNYAQSNWCLNELVAMR